MTPVDMTTAHEPPNSFGDCYRACVASLLDMRNDDVPHFFDDYAESTDGVLAHDRLTAFLRPRGLYPLGFTIADEHKNHWFDCLRGLYILGGTTTRGTKHYVIATGRGTLVHDPHPTDKSGVGPDPDGTFCIVFFVKLFEWQDGTVQTTKMQGENT